MKNGNTKGKRASYKWQKSQFRKRKAKYWYVKCTLLVLFFGILFSRGYVTFEKTGNNMFEVYLNDTYVGVTGDEEHLDSLLVSVRKKVAENYDGLMFADLELRTVGQEVLYGYVDDDAVIAENMEKVIKQSIIETMQPAYTVKLNNFMVNLADMEQVKELLQAAVDKYDEEKKFMVELIHDEQKEFSVFTTQISKREEVEEALELEKNKNVFAEGIGTFYDDFEKYRLEEKEESFEDYEYGIKSMDFSEQIEIVEAYLPKSSLTNLAEAKERVIKEQETASEYVVVSGDTLSEIAIKVNIPMDQLVEMNRELLPDINTPIHIGDKLVITIPHPELSVERAETNYYEETYDADIVYIDVDDWYTNHTEVVTQPSAGFRKIVAEVRYVNDQEVSREIVKQEVVMEAVAKVVKRGTKVPPTYIKPINGGRRSSGFGKRTAPTKGASTYHKGVDWATPTGTAVYASCGGTVEKAGWGSGYGYVIYINHEDGRQTRYGHLSKTLVTAGQKVKQGDKIALSGNTGVTSGPHVHFEILIDGKQVDPEKYLNK